MSIDTILPSIGNFGTGIAAIFCGIVAIIQGKDKQDKTICANIHKETEEKFTTGKVQFAQIDLKLQQIKEVVDDLKKKLDDL